MNREVEVTWIIALRIFWEWFWVSFLANVLMGTFALFVGTISAYWLNATSAQALTYVIAYSLILPADLYIFKIALAKQYKRFRIKIEVVR